MDMNMEVNLPTDHNINSQNNMMATNTVNKQVKSNSIGILKGTQIATDKTEQRTQIQTATLSSLEKNPFVPTIVVSKFNNPSVFITNQNESSKLKETPISKTANSNVKVNHLVMPTKNIKKPITIITPSTIFRLPPKLNTVGANATKPKQQVKIISSSNSTSELYIVPHNGMNYIVKKVQSKPGNDSTKNFSPLASPSTIKSINNLEKEKKIFVKKSIPQCYGKRKIPNTTQVEKLPDGSFRMVQNNKDAPHPPLKFVGKTFTARPGTNFVRPQLNTVPSGTTKPQVLKTFQYINPNKIRFIRPRNNLSAPVQPSKYINATKGVKIVPRSIIKKGQPDNQETGIKSTKVPAYNISNMTKSSTFKLVPVRQLKPAKFIQLTKAQLKNLPTTTIYNKKNDLKSNSGTTAMSNKTIDKFPKVLNSNAAVGTFENKTERKQEEVEDDDKPSCLVCCQYEYCEAIVLERELVDNMFCSVSCKNSTYGITTTEVKEEVSPPEEPKLDRKMILQKLRNMIELKRSKLLQSEKTDSKDCLNKPSTLENSSNKSKLNIEINDAKKPKILKTAASKQKTTTQKNEPRKKLKVSITAPPPTNSSLCEDSAEARYLKSVADGKEILTYMKTKEFRSAPKKLFKSPFPDKINNFKVNQKLEGIDPEHEALFCVMTVVKICGFRLKLHFDGYPDDYDFWVNADCPNLFYANFCNENSRTLQPPKNYKKPFNWSDYLLKSKATSVPKNILVSTVNTTFFQDHKFKIGDKLEALDKVTRTLAKQLICVATVADILGRRIRIHFDGWTNDFDYWTDISSTNLHPIKWCDNNGRCLSAPYGYTDSKGRKRFCWAEYLKETNTEAVPENAFIRVPLREFTTEMAIEIVDLVLPSLIRIARIVNVKDNEIKVLYDGFDQDYAYWVEDDNPDIHPIGWCFKTSHPLEMPSATLWSCNVKGCSGKGNSNSSKPNHISVKDCPYELETWKKISNGSVKLLDRLTPDNVPKPSMAATTKNSKYRKNEQKTKGKKKLKGKKNKELQEKAKKRKQKTTINVRQKKTINERQEEKNEHNEKEKNKHQEIEINEHQESEKNELENEKNKQNENEKNELEKVKIEDQEEEKNETEIKIEPQNTDIIESDVSTPVKQMKNINSTDKLETEDNELKINRTCDIVREYKRKSTNESMAELGLKWARIYSLKGIPVFSAKDPRIWSVEEVAKFVDLVLKNQNIENPITVSDRFIAEEIDGECFLMLNKTDLVSILNIPLGPALKLNNVIKILQVKASIFQNIDPQVS